ncbi:Putative AGC protein kinase family protein [Zea mays]|uniref:Putative AGC protein kinase family protein n=1 Tax=Zea mays TaxID=4577 RepID=A0A1D6FN85_MAIZE|nr:Putative AGC protein kinase family protein [Zea mays]
MDWMRLEKILKKYDLFGIQTHPIPLNPHGLRANRTRSYCSTLLWFSGTVLVVCNLCCKGSLVVELCNSILLNETLPRHRQGMFGKNKNKSMQKWNQMDFHKFTLFCQMLEGLGSDSLYK